MSDSIPSESMGKWAVRIAVVIALILAAWGLFYAGNGVGEIRGESQYTGHVIDVVEDKGLIFRPNWINMKTNPRSSDIQSYCIRPSDENSLLPQMYEAMEQGHRVTVSYSRPLWVNPHTCRSSDAILHSVEVVNESVYSGTQE